MRRGSAWLRDILEEMDIKPNDLARELRDERRRRGEQVDDRAVPRALVGCWIRAEKAITADRAFAIGTSLANLGHRYVSGVFAVAAIGHFADFARMLRTLAATKLGASLAIDIIAHVPLVAEADTTPRNSAVPANEHLGLVGTKEVPLVAIERARQSLLAKHDHFNSPLIKTAWEARSERPQYESSLLEREAAQLSLAINNAEADEVPMMDRWGAVVFHLGRWNDRLGGHDSITNAVLLNIIRYKGDKMR